MLEILILCLWLMGIISPFIGLSEYQGLFWAIPAGIGAGVTYARYFL